MKHLLLLCMLLIGTPASARQIERSAAPSDVLQGETREYRTIDLALTEGANAADRRALRDRAIALKQAVTVRTAQAITRLAAVTAQRAQLGMPVAGIAEAGDVRAARRRLDGEQAALDSNIKRDRLLSVQIDQLIAQTTRTPGSVLAETLSTRTLSPLSPDFWQAIGDTLPHDVQRVGLLLHVEEDAIAAARTRALLPCLLGLAIALTLLFPLRLWLRRLGRRLMIDHAPASRLRRSGQAFWLVALGALLPGVAAVAVMAGLRTGGVLALGWEPIAAAIVRGSSVAGLICGLGAGLLMRNQPSWRLLPISDRTAVALRPWTWAAALVVLVTVLFDAFRHAAGASNAGHTGADAIIAAAHISLGAGLLIRIGRLRLSAIASGEAIDDGAGETGTALASLAAWAAVLGSLIPLLLGFISLSLLVARLLLWLPVVIATFYLLLSLTDDLCVGLISRDSPLGRGLHRGFGVRASLIDQAGVALSALLRILLCLVGVTIATGPFGSNIGSLFDQFAQLAQGITIGQVTISPGAVARAIAVLVTALFAVRTIQRWLIDRYLPVTDLDAGARNSIATVARYSGLILASLWALASLGIGIERIALLLSALSVGIGFGLQAITQNFVSGLILLAERPVKIGDLVRIGDQEGDVRRISVRATEIQIADRSTLIVPNSELITKTIRNMTLADPIGRIQLQFSVRLGTDIANLRDMLAKMYETTPSVLSDPEPKIFVDSIADDRININSFAYVGSPREVYPTRSDLLFRLLTELPAAGIELGSAPQQLQLLPRGR